MFSSSQQCLTIFSVQILHFFVKCIPKYSIALMLSMECFLNFIFRLLLLYKSTIDFLNFKKDFTYLREGGREEEREGEETSMCGCLSCALHWGPGPQPRHVPWLGIEPLTFGFSGRCSIHWATPARAQLTSFYVLALYCDFAEYICWIYLLVLVCKNGFFTQSHAICE